MGRAHLLEVDDLDGHSLLCLVVEGAEDLSEGAAADPPLQLVPIPEMPLHRAPAPPQDSGAGVADDAQLSIQQRNMCSEKNKFRARL